VEIINAFVIIGAVVVLSGLIAYIGDRIGMKMGKKRVSLFGLRPRYSSIIITIVTGILIAVLSVTILLAVYSELRQALFNINDVLTRLEYLNEELENRDQELAARDQQLESKDQELSNLQQEIEAKEDEIAAKESEIEAREEEIAKRDQEIAAVESELEELTENRNQLQQRVEELSSQREELESQVTELGNQISELEADYDELREVANQLQAGVIYYMGEDMVYQKGDVVYSDVLEGGRSEQETISALNRYLQAANQVAREKEIEVNEETGMALRLQTEDILNAARIIYNMESGSRVIVSLIARVNVPKNDWLYANFQLYEDFKVFEKGQLISSREISAEQSSEEIETELEALLQDINQKAISQGLLPDNSGQVGSINFSQFYDLVNRVRSASGEVRINIYAGTDIWRQDRLDDNLDFELEDIKADGSAEEANNE
jgi:DNA repair exonuclease SbcCD ATPase subunit